MRNLGLAVLVLFGLVAIDQMYYGGALTATTWDFLRTEALHFGRA